jgi:hypothetical protein
VWTAIPDTTLAHDVDRLGFDSLTNYQFCHFTNIDRDYAEIMVDVRKEWDRMDTEFTVPYFPHVSVGWDNNPRFETFRPGIVKNNTPNEIAKAFRAARDYVDAHPNQPPLITVNSWNEWTETSYLQPDDLYGYGYLEVGTDCTCERDVARSGLDADSRSDPVRRASGGDGAASTARGVASADRAGEGCGSSAALASERLMAPAGRAGGGGARPAWPRPPRRGPSISPATPIST